MIRSWKAKNNRRAERGEKVTEGGGRLMRMVKGETKGEENGGGRGGGARAAKKGDRGERKGEKERRKREEMLQTFKLGT